MGGFLVGVLPGMILFCTVNIRTFILHLIYVHIIINLNVFYLIQLSYVVLCSLCCMSTSAWVFARYKELDFCRYYIVYLTSVVV